MSIKSRYILSVTFDLLIFSGIYIIVSKSYIIDFTVVFERSILFVSIFFYLLQDIIFINHSLGKIIFGIKVVSPDGITKAKFHHIVIRRVIEIYFMFYVLFKTQIDGFGFLAKTRIVLTKTKNDNWFLISLRILSFYNCYLGFSIKKES